MAQVLKGFVPGPPAPVQASGLLVEGGDVLRIYARAVTSGMGASTIWIAGIDATTGAPLRYVLPTAALALVDWSLETLLTWNVPRTMFLQSIGGALFKGAGASPREYFGFGLTAKGAATNLEYFGWGRYTRVGQMDFWSWGQDSQSPWYDPSCPCKMFTFQGTIVNGAGGAGTQSYTFAPGTGGRIRLVAGRFLNGDTATRTPIVDIQDGAGRSLVPLIEGGTIGIGGSLPLPHTHSSFAATDTSAGLAGNDDAAPWIAGANILSIALSAVAASQDTALGAIFEVYGGAPTIVLAGASTPTVTTNVSRFEGG
jgi:hypothetical protein